MPILHANLLVLLDSWHKVLVVFHCLACVDLITNYKFVKLAAEPCQEPAPATEGSPSVHSRGRGASWFSWL